jgi:uncharacterized protein involved in exopolysaccharide biosynthesis
LQPLTEHPATAVDEAASADSSPKELVLFAMHAARQNLALCALVTLAIGLISGTVVAALPVLYDATCKIFVQEGGAVTSTLASGRDRYRPIEGTRGLQEFILARDNLLSIVREAKLFEKWPSTRPAPMRVKDLIMETLFGPADRRDMERAFAEMLALSISAEKEGESVRIHAQWRDARSAYDIARLVQRNFLAARAAHDLGPIRRAIPFLDAELHEAEQEIDTAVARVQAIKSARPVKASEPKEQPAASPADTTEVAELSQQLAETRREQRALVEPRRERATQLKLELMDLKAQYSPDHPLVRQHEARIATLEEVSGELAGLRNKESQLLHELSKLGVMHSASELVGSSAKGPASDDPELASLLSRLGTALRKSEEVAARLENARIELATAEADVKHRYVVVEQPEVPGKPIKAKKPLFFALVVLAALLGGVLAGAVRELRRGRLVEAWQVRQLGIQLLGEVELK